MSLGLAGLGALGGLRGSPAGPGIAAPVFRGAPVDPDLDRHAARRSPAGLRLHGRSRTPASTRSRRRRRPLRARLLARAADAAGARVAPTGPPAVRTRRARQRRLHAQARTSGSLPARAARSRLHHRRLRLGLRAARATPASARASTSTTARCPPRPRELSIGQVQRRRRDDAGRAPRPGCARARRASRSSSSSTSTSRTSPTRRRSAFAVATRRTTARSPYADEIVGGCSTELRAHQLYDRSTIVLLVRPRRRARRSRRAGARPLPLPRDDPRAADHQAGRQTRGRRRVAAPVQHIDLVPTHPRSGRRAEPPATARADRSSRCSTGRGTLADTGIYSEALYARYHFGWSELYRSPTPATANQGAARRAVRSRARSAGAASIADERPQVRQAMRERARGPDQAPSIAAPAAVTDEDAQRLPRSATSAAAASASLSLPGRLARRSEGQGAACSRSTARPRISPAT